MIQTTLKQLCEAVELQTYQEGGTSDRAGSRQAGNQDTTASQLKTKQRQTHRACCTYRMAHMMEQLHQGPVAKAREREKGEERQTEKEGKKERKRERGNNKN